MNLLPRGAWKKFAPMESKLFPFRVDPFSEGIYSKGVFSDGVYLKGKNLLLRGANSFVLE